MRFSLPADLWTAAIDGGTTNTRVRLLRGEQVAAEAATAVGARDVAAGDRSRLTEAIREGLRHVLEAAGIARPDVLVASGMLTSDVGLRAVPHVVAPAGIEELAAGAVWTVIPEISAEPILLIPGVRTPAGPGPDGWAAADVMRGEECETIGLWTESGSDRLRDRDEPGRTLFVWPGSHTKVVAVDEAGRILASQTTLAGELISAVARHTVLASSLPGTLPRTLNPEAVAAGGRLVLREGLGRVAFLVRIAQLTGTYSEADRAAFWIGAVARDDVSVLLRHPLLADHPRAPLHVGGSEPLRGLYERFLREHHAGPVQAHPGEHHAARGAAIVAHHRVRLDATSAARDSADRVPGPTGS